MKEIVGFIRQYARDVNKPILIVCTLFIAVLVWLNYDQGFEYRLLTEAGLPFPWITGHWIIYSIAFLFPYSLICLKRKKELTHNRGFIICLLAAPIIFAIKVGIDTHVHLSSNYHWDEYWNAITYWPPRFIAVLLLLAILHTSLNRTTSFYGLTPKKIIWKPYFIMLLIMVPLIAAASTQPDFLAAYPKMKEILPLPANANPGWLYKLFFELSYGSDFLSIEFFFRGFLVIGFMKWAGKDAILPMACFYCSIHFGKPLGECISSYFGGMLLGIVSYHTQSIYGGLMVHLGIAWLMEIGGYIGNMY
ncbi:MAG: CPBP family glutamic-type intramembrane protease [Chitinophagaceae bacterium]